MQIENITAQCFVCVSHSRLFRGAVYLPQGMRAVVVAGCDDCDP